MIPCWANLGCCYRCYTTFWLSAAGHIQHRQVFALLRSSTVLAMPACRSCSRLFAAAVLKMRLSPRSFTGSTVTKYLDYSYTIVGRSRWVIFMEHTCLAQASQPASPPCLQAYQSHHQGFPQIGDKMDLSHNTHLACIHSVPQQPAQNRHWSPPKRESVFPAANFESDTPRPRPNNIASRKTVSVSPPCGLAVCGHTHAAIRGQAVSLHQIFHKTSRDQESLPRDTVDPRPSRHHSAQRTGVGVWWISCPRLLPECGCHHPKRTKPILLDPCTHHYVFPPPQKVSHPTLLAHCPSGTGTRLAPAYRRGPKIQYTKVHVKWYLSPPTYLVLVPNVHLLQSSSRTTACTSTSLVGLTG